MQSSIMLAADFRAIGLSVAAAVTIGFVVLFIRNSFTARSELGAEIELAPNRKEYFPDEVLEGQKLDRSLSVALVLLMLMAIALPFYWVAEPGRQAGAVENFRAGYEREGGGLYNLGSVDSAQCVNCHAAGGVGGSADYTLLDADGQFVALTAWKAPALDTLLLRYSEDEILYILNYGRPGSPMAAWGAPGGGPKTSQQLQSIIEYLRPIQTQSLDPIDIVNAGEADDLGVENASDQESLDAQVEAEKVADGIRAEVKRSIDDGEFASVGEAVFNLGLFSGYEAGGLSCGRCHTAGWSLEEATNRVKAGTSPNVLEPGIAGCGGGDPSGIGFNLCGGSLHERFPDDTWLQPPDANGNYAWYEVAIFDDTKVTAPVLGSPADYDGSYVLSMDGTQIPIDNGRPIAPSGAPYFILGPGDGEDGEERNGDLAECSFVSGLWTSDDGVYPFDGTVDLQVNPEDASEYLDPAELTLEEVTALGLGGETLSLPDGLLATGCTVIEMPPRTSKAHYDFIYNGAEAGTGYGRGGMSTAGMMPGFGKVLPPDLLQAVVDYERGL